MINLSKIQNYVTISNKKNLINLDGSEENGTTTVVKRISSFHLPKKSFDYDRLSHALLNSNSSTSTPYVTITDENNSRMSSDEKLANDKSELIKSNPEIQRIYSFLFLVP